MSQLVSNLVLSVIMSLRITWKILGVVNFRINNRNQIIFCKQTLRQASGLFFLSKGKVSAIYRITKGAMLLKCQGKNTRTPTHIHTQKMNMTHPKRCFRGVVVRVLYQRRLARFCHACCRATERKCFSFPFFCWFLSGFMGIANMIYVWMWLLCEVMMWGWLPIRVSLFLEEKYLSNVTSLIEKKQVVLFMFKNHYLMNCKTVTFVILFYLVSLTCTHTLWLLKITSFQKVQLTKIF